MSSPDQAPSIVPADEGQLLEIIAHLGAALMQADLPTIQSSSATSDQPQLATAIHRTPG